MAVVVPTCHAPRRIRVGLDHEGSFSHTGGTNPSAEMAAFTGPSWGLKIHAQISVMGTSGMIAGRK